MPIPMTGHLPFGITSTTVSPSPSTALGAQPFSPAFGMITGGVPATPSVPPSDGLGSSSDDDHGGGGSSGDGGGASDGGNLSLSASEPGPEPEASSLGTVAHGLCTSKEHAALAALAARDMEFDLQAVIEELNRETIKNKKEPPEVIILHSTPHLCLVLSCE